MARVNLSLLLLASLVTHCLAAEAKDLHLQSKLLCSQCGACDVSRCPPSESYPHMTEWDGTLIAGALQSDYVKVNDRGIYSVPDIKGGTSKDYDAYFGWESTSGSASGYLHREEIVESYKLEFEDSGCNPAGSFNVQAVIYHLWGFRNYMDKCSKGQSYLTVDNHGKVALRALSSLTSLAQADWKSFNPPKNLNHRGFRFWQSRSTGMCLTMFGGKSNKRVAGVADCKFDGSNPFQLLAFRFHYHSALCCCNLHNE